MCRVLPRRRADGICSQHGVKANLSPGNFLFGWVLGYGGEAEVVGPPDVRAQFEARVDELARLYA